MNIIKRDTNWTPRFCVPIHPNHLFESNCPKCGGLAIGDELEYHPTINMGKSDLPSRVKFTCYAPGPTPDIDCDGEWEEQIILRLTVEKVKTEDGCQTT